MAYHNGTLSEFVRSNITYSGIELSCGSGINYTFNSSSGAAATVINTWSDDINLDTDTDPMGAPLLDGNGRVTGIYIAKDGGVYTDSTGTVCGKDTAYFVHEFFDPTGLLSGTFNGIKVTPCVDVIVEDEDITMNKTTKASVKVTGKSRIHNVQVRFTAGVEVILENGFDSGNDFIAEIKPCTPAVTPLSKNMEFAGTITEEEIINDIAMREDNTLSSIIAYPTIEIDNYITIESIGLENIKYSIFSVEGKEILKGEYNPAQLSEFQFQLELPHMTNGIYFLNLYSNNQLKTIKLLKQ